MKKLFMLFSFCPYFIMGQIEMNFENGIDTSWIQYPPERWSVSHENPLEGSSSLVHSFDNSLSGTDCLSLMHDDIDPEKPEVSWEFLLHYDYNPSGSNNWAIYFLAENSADHWHKGKTDAFVLGVNQKNSDDMLYLYRLKEGRLEELYNTGLNWEEDVSRNVFRFRIFLHNDSLLIFGGIKNEIPDILARLQLKEESFYNHCYFGLKYNYTSSKDRLLKFDDLEINGKFVVDSIAPELQGIKFLSSNQILFIFNEEVTAGKNFNFFPGRLIDTLIISGNQIRIECGEDLLNEFEYHFILKDICDSKNNAGSVDTSFIFFYPRAFDIIINEIMYDPSPAVYLPEVDYIELYNRSSYVVDLTGWKAETKGNSWELPEVYIRSNSFLVLCESDEMNFLPDDAFVAVTGRANLMNNEGAEILLCDPYGKVVDAVFYDSDWYSDNFKSSGGWSLERIDSNNLCAGKFNWSYSDDYRGGTPGSVNLPEENNLTDKEPFLSRIIYVDSGSFILKFSECLSPDIIPSHNILIEAEGFEPDSLYYANNLRDEVICRFKAMPDQLELHLTGEIADCSGNNTYISSNFIYGPVQIPNPGDVLISEILYAPFPGCAEFIELYNASGKILSLDRMRLAFFAGEFTEPPDEVLSERKLLFFPGEYLALSNNRSSLMNFYHVPFPGNLIQCSGLCGLPDTGGRLILYNRSGEKIDEMTYKNADHFPMLTDVHGVSLERIRLNENSGTHSEWHSASSLSGFATPGYKNSQALDEISGNVKEFSVLEEIFTPDNDGMDDVAVFQYFLEKDGYLGTFRIFDATGRLICIPVNNELMGVQGSISWDGRDQNGMLCPSGIYLGFLEIFHLSGKKKKFKQTVVLGRGRF